jgi:cobalt-zinc-cadmium efflux system protein
MDPETIGRALAAHPGVSEVHDLHVWEVTSGFPALSAHVLVPAGEDCHARRAELEQLLVERFGLEHTTLQIEHESSGGLLDITR